MKEKESLFTKNVNKGLSKVNCDIRETINVDKITKYIGDYISHMIFSKYNETSVYLTNNTPDSSIGTSIAFTYVGKYEYIISNLLNDSKSNIRNITAFQNYKIFKMCRNDEYLYDENKFVTSLYNVIFGLDKRIYSFELKYDYSQRSSNEFYIIIGLTA